MAVDRGRSCLRRLAGTRAYGGPVQVLWWWSLPVLATLVAVCWAAWVRRAPRVPGDAETVAAHAAFRAALARSAAPPAAPPAGATRNTESPPVV